MSSSWQPPEVVKTEEELAREQALLRRRQEVANELAARKAARHAARAEPMHSSLQDVTDELRDIQRLKHEL